MYGNPEARRSSPAVRRATGGDERLSARAGALDGGFGGGAGCAPTEQLQDRGESDLWNKRGVGHCELEGAAGLSNIVH